MGFGKEIEFQHTTFRDFNPPFLFDKIMIGNAHHHLYNDIGGGEWIAKLSAMTKEGGYVLVEGPIDSSCPDLKDWYHWDEDDRKKFDRFLSDMERYHFTLIREEPTVDYTPGRSVRLFRKEAPYFVKQFSNNDGNVYKGPDFYEMDMIRVELGSYAPFSNPIAGWYYRLSKVLGWGEKKITKLEKIPYFKDEIRCFKAHCIRNAFLAKNGYMDIDGATINFGYDDGKFINFDKGAVLPINRLEPEKHFDLNGGIYFVLLYQSYRKIPERIYRELSETLSTLDSEKIWKLYEKIPLELK
jgi:hypothetical protein